jgi:ABC-type glycerol-3-phosphate transport system substrate-binding protein
MKAHVARAAVAVAVLVAGGCGGGSSSSSTTAQPSTFRADFKVTINQFKNTAHAIGVAIQHAPGESDSQIGSAFSGLAAQWQAAVNHLKSLTPPPAVAGEFGTLKEAATATESDLQAVVAAAQTHSGSAARQAGASLVRDVLKAKTASEVISHKLGIT